MNRIVDEQEDVVVLRQLVGMCGPVQLLWRVPAQGEAGPVAVPSRVAPVDVGPVVDGLQRHRQQRDAERRAEWMPRPEDLPALAEDAERITCLQLARTPEELSACAEAG